MANHVGHDRLALIRIEGMHCHRCEAAIRKSLEAYPGVHEVEVDFPTGQASVLYDNDRVNVRQLMEGVNKAGYKATGFSQREADRPGSAA
jgi:copper chaperone CopZ